MLQTPASILPPNRFHPMDEEMEEALHASLLFLPSCQQQLQVHQGPRPGCDRVCCLAPRSPSPQHRLQSKEPKENMLIRYEISLFLPATGSTHQSVHKNFRNPSAATASRHRKQKIGMEVVCGCVNVCVCVLANWLKGGVVRGVAYCKRRINSKWIHRLAFAEGFVERLVLSHQGQLINCSC